MQWKFNDFKGKQCGGMDSPLKSSIFIRRRHLLDTHLNETKHLSELNAFANKKKIIMDGII